MVRKFKKRTLFFAGIIGLSILSLFGLRTENQGDVFTEQDLKDLISPVPPSAHADYYGPSTGPSDSGGSGDAGDGGGDGGGDGDGCPSGGDGCQ